MHYDKNRQYMFQIKSKWRQNFFEMYVEKNMHYIDNSKRIKLENLNKCKLHLKIISDICKWNIEFF